MILLYYYYIINNVYLIGLLFWNRPAWCRMLNGGRCVQLVTTVFLFVHAALCQRVHSGPCWLRSCLHRPDQWERQPAYLQPSPVQHQHAGEHPHRDLTATHPGEDKHTSLSLTHTHTQTHTHHLTHTLSHTYPLTQWFSTLVLREYLSWMFVLQHRDRKSVV